MKTSLSILNVGKHRDQLWRPFLLLAASLAAVTAAKEVATNTFYVKIHADPNEPDLAHKIARRNGFHNLGPVRIPIINKPQ